MSLLTNEAGNCNNDGSLAEIKLNHSNPHNHTKYGCQYYLIKLKLIMNEPFCRKFLYSLIWIIVTYYIIGITNAIADNRALSSYPADEHLADIGFDLMEDIFGSKLRNEIFSASNDICCYLSLMSCISFMMICFIWNEDAVKVMVTIATHWAVIWNIMFTIRSFNVILTPLPTPKHQISKHECYHWDNIWIAPFLILAGTHHSCHDFFFSGHTTNTTLCCLIITYYSKVSVILRRYKYLRLFICCYIWGLLILMIMFMLVLQDHYSIDISMGVLLTGMMFYLYQYQFRMHIGVCTWWTHYRFEELDHINR